MRRRLESARPAELSSANEFPPGHHVVDVVEVRSAPQRGEWRRAKCVGRAGRRIWLEDRRPPRLGSRIRIEVQLVGDYRLMTLPDGQLAALHPDGSLAPLEGEPPPGAATPQVVRWFYLQERKPNATPLLPTEAGSTSVEA